jgi:hypothetical protein
MTSFRLSRLWVAPVVVLALAACDSTGINRYPLSLSLSTRPSSAPLASWAPLMSISVASGSNSLVINKAQLVLAEIELEPAAAADCSTTADDECPDVELGPVLIDLPLDAAVPTDLHTLVPAGSYSELEFKVDAVEDGEHDAAAFLAAHPEFRAVSLRVEGTYNGQPFVYTSNVEGEIKLQFASPLVVGNGGASNVTLAVDVATWFKDASGNLLDPSNSANASQIANNIQRSFRAFEDDDRDGVEDATH